MARSRPLAVLLSSPGPGSSGSELKPGEVSLYDHWARGRETGRRWMFHGKSTGIGVNVTRKSPNSMDISGKMINKTGGFSIVMFDYQRLIPYHIPFILNTTWKPWPRLRSIHFGDPWGGPVSSLPGICCWMIPELVSRSAPWWLGVKGGIMNAPWGNEQSVQHRCTYMQIYLFYLILSCLVLS